MEKENKMKESKVSSLVWSMGLPMVVSMVLQALYNIVDTAFVINMGEDGAAANLALTYAFPFQIFMIALGVGLGIGVNALLSKSLGSGDKKRAGLAGGTGLFIAFIIYLLFFCFGLFLSKWFISLQAGDNQKAVELGSQYLSIVATMSFGQMGYTVYERFLVASGKTMLSTIGQISGAVTNIVLDYVFIYPLKMGVAGAAYATVIGQCVSLAVDMIFHYTLNKEVHVGLKDLLPKKDVVVEIAKTGVPAAIMQALLSVMMFGVNLILGTASSDKELLQGSFGIYYKIQQIPLFASFGMSNALISIVSFNYGAGENKRVQEAAKWGCIDTMIVGLAFTAIFEIFANGISSLFSLASGGANQAISETVISAIRLASIGYIFMSFSVASQGVLQGLGKIYSPVIISFCRLALFVFPFVYLFINLPNASFYLWFAFPIGEILTSLVSYFFLRRNLKSSLAPVAEVA